MGRLKIIPDETIAAIRQAYIDGETWVSICSRFAVSIRKVSQALHDIPRRGSRRKLTDEQIAEMRKRYVDGEKWATLAQRFGVCERNIWYYVRDLPRREYHISAQQAADMRARYRLGETLQSLSKAFGFARGSIYQHCRDVVRVHKPLVDDETIAEVRRMYLAGDLLRDIIDVTGCNCTRVYKIIADLPKRSEQPRQSRGHSVQAKTVVPSKPVIEAYCRVCPAGVMTWEIDYNVQVGQVAMTCPVCGTWYALTTLVDKDALNATLARLARSEAGEYAEDDDQA